MNHPTYYEMMARNKQQEMWAVARQERMVRRSSRLSKVRHLFAGLRREKAPKQVQPARELWPLQV